jgi:hypothetical protein
VGWDSKTLQPWQLQTYDKEHGRDNHRLNLNSTDNSQLTQVLQPARKAAISHRTALLLQWLTHNPLFWRMANYSRVLIERKTWICKQQQCV